eukprot:GFKZ01002685.1.p1 GENE.GFKZ01002685.1~~GFKZ01002685.1.p1  ORF type:complete len:1126 (-),score=187.61 GFKZ01002685.1:798-4175(-)
MVKKRNNPDEYDDDDDPEEYDSYGEEEEAPRSSRPKKRKKRNALIDLEAEEDDAEDDEEDEDGPMGNLIADDDEDVEIDRAREQMRAQRFERERVLRNENPEETERYYRERFGDDNYAEDDEADAPETTGIDQQSLLPTIRDPRLWIVRCKKPGHERRAVLSLLQKSFNLRRKGIDIGIFSAIAPEHLKGRIYIEAFSAAQVEFAINGLELFTAYEGIKALRLDEMTDVLRPGKRPGKQAVGNWVRISRGLYKGDLAQVCGIREGSGEGHLMVRMIPRLDLKGEKDYMEGFGGDTYEEDKEKSNGARRKGRPPQKLFSKSELFRLTGSVEVYSQKDSLTGEVFQVWNSDRYRHGLLYKPMSGKTLITGEAVQPQLQELDKWLLAEKNMRQLVAEDPNSMDAEEASRGLGLDISAVAGSRNAKLFKGDTVRVTAGEQKGVTGTISSFDGDVVLIQIPDFPDALRVARSDVTKQFKLGDHIKVSSGKFAGYAGSIVKVERDVLTVFTDSTHEEIVVLSMQVADSSDINTDIGSQRFSAAHAKMHYELFDLVQLLADSSEVGVVIQVRNEGVTILTSQNQTKTVSFAAIKNKITDPRIRAKDSRGNPIAANDTIHVVAGPLKERQGIVKHVTGNTVFFKARDEIKNCGMLAVISKECTASTAAARTLTFTQPTSQASRFKVPAPIPRGSIASFASARSRGGGRRGARDPLMRKDVKITRGPHKGYTGRVVDTTDDTVRVELSSKMKTITISKSKVKDLSDTSGSRSAPSSNFRRDGQRPAEPWLGSQSGSRSVNPMQTPRSSYNRGQTPNVDRFASSQRFGGRTPRIGAAMTPAHSGFGSATPGRDDFRPGRTPSRAGEYGSFKNPYGGGMPHTPAPEMANPYGPGPRTPSTPAIGIPKTPVGGSIGIVEPRTPANIVEPSTPAYPNAEPRTPAPGLEPATPAPGMEPATPAPGFEPRTPAPGQEPRTPAGVEPGTPMVQEPATPHTPGVIPQTPHVPEEEPSELGYRVLIDVEVLVSSQNRLSAVVTDAAVNGSAITVRMLTGERAGDEFSVPGTDITPVQPRPEVGAVQELVKVLDGPSAGQVGRLESVVDKDQEGLEGFIRFTTGETATLSMSLVAKCSETAANG